jgi:hypothetical protein
MDVFLIVIALRTSDLALKEFIKIMINLSNEKNEKINYSIRCNSLFFFLFEGPEQ